MVFWAIVELFSGDVEQTCFACDLYTSVIDTHVALYVNTNCGILGHWTALTDHR